MSEVRGSWWRPVALLLILIAFSMDLLVWHFSDGAEFSAIFNQFTLGFTLALGLTGLALLLVSIGSVHQYARWKEQIIGLILISGLGLSSPIGKWQVHSKKCKEEVSSYWLASLPCSPHQDWFSGYCSPWLLEENTPETHS